MITVTHSRSLVPGDVLVVGVFRYEDGTIAHGIRGKLGRWLTDAIDRLAFDAGRDSTATVPAPAWTEYRSIVFVGVGNGPETTNQIRYAAGTASRSLSGHVVVHLSARSTSHANAALEVAIADAPCF